jgi:hypothetical protein
MYKGSHIDGLEKFHIYKYDTLEECLNEQHTTGTNILFDVLLEKYRNVGIPGQAT